MGLLDHFRDVSFESGEYAETNPDYKIHTPGVVRRPLLACIELKHLLVLVFAYR